MIKCVIILACFAIVALAAPDEEVELLHHEHHHDENGNYKYRYTLSDGTKRVEKGDKMENSGHAVVGAYSWIDPKGKAWTVQYTADKNGYRANIVPFENLPDKVIDSLLG